jgi:hypothetical protein
MALTEKIRDICKREVKIPYFAFAQNYFEKRKLEEIRDRIIDAGMRQREQRYDQIIGNLNS